MARVRVSGFRVERVGFGFRDQGSGVCVWGLAFRFEFSVCMVQCSVLGVQVMGLRVQGLEFGVQGCGYRVACLSFRVWGFGCLNLG